MVALLPAPPWSHHLMTSPPSTTTQSEAKISNPPASSRPPSLSPNPSLAPSGSASCRQKRRIAWCKVVTGGARQPSSRTRQVEVSNVHLQTRTPTHRQFECSTPMQPCSAIAIAILLSVTVSIAADAKGNDLSSRAGESGDKYLVRNNARDDPTGHPYPSLERDKPDPAIATLGTAPEKIHFDAFSSQPLPGIKMDLDTLLDVFPIKIPGLPHVLFPRG